MGRVKLEKRKPVTVAYLEYKGSYSSIPFDNYIGRLYGWAKEKKIRPGFYPLAVFYDNPDTTPPERCRTDIAIPVAGEPKGDDEVNIRKMPAMTVATISHKGEAEEYKKTYDLLTKWVSENGFEWDGPPIEIYTKKPDVVDGRTIIHAKIMAPVKRK
jgi:AraC family transcriptional regulator